MFLKLILLDIILCGEHDIDQITCLVLSGPALLPPQ